MVRSRLLLIGTAVTVAAVATAAPPAGKGPAGMAAAGAPVVVGMAPDAPDPFPIARLRVTEAQLPDAAKALAPGPLTRLTRGAFEEKVRAAGAAVLAARSVPRLVEARYVANLSGGTLSGSAEWTITHPGRGPAVLPLDPLKVALRDAVWADGSSAAVGAFTESPGGGAAVWVPGPGRHVLRAKWTVAGTGPASDRAFDLRLPACPASSLDLDLPDDRTPVSGADVLVTGPVPGAPAGRKRWLLRFGEKGRFDLAVRAPTDAGGSGPVAFATAARYDFAPAEVGCTFDFDLRATRAPAGAWAFSIPTGLRVADVTVNNLAGWRVDPAANELRVTLRQPASASKVRVTAAAPLPSGTGLPAPLPMIRPANGLPTEERVELHLSAGFDLAGWDAGDYRLTDAATAADGSRVLSLVGTLLPAGSTAPARRPPSFRIGDSGPAFATTEAVAWRVDGGRTRLTARVSVKVRRGPLFRIAVRPPPGFEFDRATATPADLFGFVGPGAAGVLAVEFARPLAAGQDVEVVLEFRGPPVPIGPVARLPFPAIGVAGAVERDGWVSLAPGPGWRALPHVRPDPIDRAGEPDPAGLPDAVVVRYRGAEPAGELILSSVSPTFASSIETRFDYSGGRLSATSVVRLDVTAGVLGGVAVFEPGPQSAARSWKVTDGSNTVASATPVRLGELPAALALLGRAGGLGSVAAAAAASRAEPGTHWLVRFSRPVEDDVVLETTAAGPADPTAANRIAADWASGRRGLFALGGATHTARIDAGGALGVTAVGPVESAPADWAVGELMLSTTCTERDQLAVFRGVIAVRGGRELPVRLPTGAVPRSATVGAKAVDPASLFGDVLRLPVPAGDEPVSFEVRYRLPREERGFAWSVASPVPQVPGVSGGVRREWGFDPGVSVAWPFTARAGAGSLHDDDTTRSDYLGDAVTVLPDRYAVGVGVGLAVLVAGIGWVGARGANRWSGSALLTLLAGAGVVIAAGPPAWARAAWPVLAVGLPAAVAVVVARGRLPRPIAGAGVLLVLAVGAKGQPAGPDVVFVLSGPDGETVLAPPALLARLDTLAKPPLPRPTVVAAAYDGRVEDGLARMTAIFTVQAFGPGEQVVQLHLADVRLERVAVNGTPTNPAMAGAGRYVVPLPGPGRHAVEVRFAVPVVATGAEREVKFGVPEVPDARLAFAAPPAARQLQAPGRFGEQKAAAGDPTRFDADLGAVKVVAVRWREGPGGAGRLTVREGCVWDVSEAGAVLTACYDIRAESGTAVGFRFDLPPGLEPVRVAARGLDAAAGPVTVQSWAVGAEKNGLRPLRVDLAAPADGRVLVTIECLNRAAPTRQPVLRFPRPVGMDHRGGVYGLRANGVTIEPVGRSGVIDFAADAMVREFGIVPELRLVPGGALQAFSAPSADAAELRPNLRPTADPGTARVEATWSADLRGAIGAGTVTWSAAEPAALLEFALAARVREVRGADVAAWAQASGRVQVWFRRPVTAATIAWAADLTHDGVVKGADAVGFEPPVPRPIGPAAGPAVVRVRPADGVGLAVERDKGWTADPIGENREWRFRAAGDAAPVRVRLGAPRVGPASGFGLLDLTPREPTYRVLIELPVPAGQPAHAAVGVTGLPPGATATPESSPGVRVSERDDGDDGPAWNLDVAAATGPVRAAVVVRFPSGWAGPLPAVWAGPGEGLRQAAGVVRYIGRVGGPGVRMTGATPATPVERAEAGAKWPGEVERLRRTGGELATAGDGMVELVLPPAAPAPSAPTPTAVPPTVPPSPTLARPPPGTGEAAGWLLILLAVGVLFARVPRATWPEQAAALAGLFGHAIAAAPAFGLVVYVAARGVWLSDRLRAGRHSGQFSGE